MPCRLALAFVVFLLFCVAAGCGGGAPVASGPKGLFDAHCAECHAQAGQPGGPPKVGMSKGPDLTKITTRPGRDAKYIADFIRDPRSVNPTAKLMPAFGDKLTDEEIRSLAEYVVSTNTK
jgi:mono/diheme cytochrome c family protein